MLVVDRPDVTIESVTDATGVKVQNEPAAILIFGTRSPFTGTIVTPGISMTRSEPNVPGSFSWVQTVDQLARRLLTDGRYQRREATGFLDTYLEYPTDPQNPARVEDTPSEPLLDSYNDAGELIPVDWYSRSDVFEMYLMWTSSRPNSKPVPVRMVAWNWTGQAEWDNAANEWVLLGTPAYSANPSDADATSHPTWNGNIDGTYDSWVWED